MRTFPCPATHVTIGTVLVDVGIRVDFISKAWNWRFVIILLHFEYTLVRLAQIDKELDANAGISRPHIDRLVFVVERGAAVSVGDDKVLGDPDAVASGGPVSYERNKVPLVFLVYIFSSTVRCHFFGQLGQIVECFFCLVISVLVLAAIVIPAIIVVLCGD